MATDPYERTDLADEEPQLLQELLAEFQIQARRSNILNR